MCIRDRGNSSYQFALCSILGFGGMISLFQASGGLMGFRDLLAKAQVPPTDYPEKNQKVPTVHLKSLRG